MSAEVFLSLVIPVYNAEKYLPRMVDSILNANTGETEILLIDDGSSDGSHSLCAEYAAHTSFIRLFWQENAGPSAARNLGIRQANGKYIAFLDADDYIDPVVFSDCVSRLRDCDADIWVSDFRRVADNGCVLDEVFQIEESTRPITDAGYLEQFLQAKDCVWNVWRYIFRREFLVKNKLLFAEGFNIAEDLEFVVRALTATERFAFFHAPYYFYRVNYSHTLTRQYTPRRVVQLMTMLKRAYTQLPEGRNAELIKGKLSREYILNLSILYEVHPTARKAVKRELKEAKELMAGAQGVYKAASWAISLLGISIAAWLLYQLKQRKRLMRSIKVHLFHRG